MITHRAMAVLCGLGVERWNCGLAFFCDILKVSRFKEEANASGLGLYGGLEFDASSPRKRPKGFTALSPISSHFDYVA